MHRVMPSISVYWHMELMPRVVYSHKKEKRNAFMIGVDAVKEKASGGSYMITPSGHGCT